MLKQLLDHAVAIAPGKQWPTYDGKMLDRQDFLTSSEVASCHRQTYFSKQTQDGFRGNGYAERGNAIEAWLVEKLQYLKPHGYEFYYVGDQQRSFYDEEIGISGTPDGVMELPNGKRYLLEFKSIDPRTNKNNLPKRKHVFQVQQNMYLVQKCLGWQLEGAILFYVDASNLFDVKEFFFEYSDKFVQECIDRANKLWNATNPDDLEPEGLYNGDCDTCPHTGPCSATIDMQKALATSGAAGSPFSADELGGDSLLNEEDEQIVHDYLYTKREMKEFSDRLDELRDPMTRIVMNRNSLLVHEGAVITGKENPGRETLSKDLILDAGLDPTKFTKTGKPFITLNVKEPK